MNSSCMYGAPHKGARLFVRNKRGVTIGQVCSAHHHQHEGELLRLGYHFRTKEELIARGELPDAGKQESSEFDNDARDYSDEEWESIIRAAAASMDSKHSAPKDQPLNDNDDSSETSQTTALAPQQSAAGLSTGGCDGGATTQSDRGSGNRPASAAAHVPALRLASHEIGGVEGAGGTAPRGADRETDIAPPPTDWWRGAGTLTLSEEQRTILQASFPEDLIEVRYDGIVYVPWVYYWDRLLRAFSPFVPAMIPVSRPYPVENTLCRDYIMVVNGVFVGAATGECVRAGGNQKLTYASAVESCKSDAITKIGKVLGMGQHLFSPSWRAYFLATYSEEYKDPRGNTRFRKREKTEEL